MVPICYIKSSKSICYINELFKNNKDNKFLIVDIFEGFDIQSFFSKYKINKDLSDINYISSKIFSKYSKIIFNNIHFLKLCNLIKLNNCIKK